jgi:hypothetical protein
MSNINPEQDASFTMSPDPTVVLVGTPVTFTNTSVNVKGYTMYWNFGDGTKLEWANSGIPITHTYNVAKTYQPTLTMYNEDVIVSQAFRFVTVHRFEDPAELPPAVTKPTELKAAGHTFVFQVKQDQDVIPAEGVTLTVKVESFGSKKVADAVETFQIYVPHMHSIY